MITLAEAKEVLRIDTDNNDALISSLIASLPGYIEVTTGMPVEQQISEPLVQTVSGFILTLWYYADHADDVKLTRTIDNLLKCITLKTTRNSDSTNERLDAIEDALSHTLRTEQ